MKLLIGLLGEICAGKEEFFQNLHNRAPNDTVRYSTSNILRRTLDEWDIPASRDNLQGLAIHMDRAFGEGTLSHAIEYQLSRHVQDSVVVYDSIRWPSDIEVVKKFPCEIVYITADQKLRYQRCVKRNEKLGDNHLTFEEFQAKEQVATESMIGELSKYIHHKLVNNGSYQEYQEMIHTFFELYVRPRLR